MIPEVVLAIFSENDILFLREKGRARVQSCGC